MIQNDRNIYKTARVAAGLTQERASELIGCTSVRSIAAYECGERIPAEDIVVAMADVYGVNYLPYQHMRNNLELARSILPDICPQNIPLAILRLQKEVNDFLLVRDEVIDITCDGIIDESERERWDNIQKELDDICRAIIALKFAKEVQQ
ncbi:MAG: helix-turn-helix transcriptional regulator [Bacteroides sp.]